jgi:Leucine-rich repeat (LRR) protein
LCCRYCNIEHLPDDFVSLIKKHNPHIIELDLTSNHISELPASLHELKYLQALRVKYNRLNAVPPVCFKLQRCVTLDLAGNQIEVIPDDIVRLQSLRELDLSGNNVTSLTGMCVLLSCYP